MVGWNDSALDLAQIYFAAMAAKDVDGIMKLVGDEVTLASPLGDLTGGAAFRDFQAGFAQMIDDLTLVTAVGNGDSAVIVYVANTKPVAGAYVAEHLTVRDRKIVGLRVIYDSAPFAEYAAIARPH